MEPQNNTTANLLAQATNNDVLEEQFSDIRAEMIARFQLLPEQLQNVIKGSDYQKKLMQIAKDHGLTFDQLSTLELETTMVLIGMTRPEEYRDELQAELKKNDEEIDPIVAAVNDQVLGQIRTALAHLYEGKKDPAEVLMAAPSAPVATVAPVTPAVAPVVPQSTPMAAPMIHMTPSTMSMPKGSLSNDEKSMLEKTGVILTDTQMKPAGQMPMQSPKPSITRPNRGDILRGIENPPKAPMIQMDKLSMPLSGIPKKETDYSLPKAGGAPAAPAPTKASDPYRESVG
jgi:hypothetical protein